MVSSKWDWMNSSQSADYFVSKKQKFVTKHFAGKMTDYGCQEKVIGQRFRGLPISLAISLVYPVERIAVAGEQAIKGFANLGRAAIKQDKTIAKKGAKQLLLAPTNVLRAALSPLFAALNVGVVTPAALLCPGLAEVVLGLSTISRAELKDIRADFFNMS